MEKKNLFAVIAAVVLFLAGILVGKMLSPDYRMHKFWMNNGFAQACPCLQGMVSGCGGAMYECPAQYHNFDCPAKRLKIHHNQYEGDIQRLQRPCPMNAEVVPPLPAPEVRPLPKREEKIAPNHNIKPHHRGQMPTPLPQAENIAPTPVAPEIISHK